MHKKNFYDNLAPFYDTLMGDMSLKADFLHSLIQKHNPTAKSVLEIACGTGSIIKRLDNYYAEVAGIDTSFKMVGIARQKLPQSKIIVADMTNFSLPNRFDVVLCVFDSINHLPSLELWEETFRISAQHLNKNGIFIFDVNTEEMLRSKSLEKIWTKTLEHNVVLIKVFEEGQVYRWNIRIFERTSANNYILHEGNIIEDTFPQNKIKHVLVKYFNVLEIINENREPAIDPNKRPFYICRKK